MSRENVEIMRRIFEEGQSFWERILDCWEPHGDYPVAPPDALA